MLVRVGINRAIRRNGRKKGITHRGVTLELPEGMDRKQVHDAVTAHVRGLDGGWLVTGYHVIERDAPEGDSMDDAARWRAMTREEREAEEEAEIERYRRSWHARFEEEGDPIRDHARRVVLGEEGGHWCNSHPNQREAARRFLSDIGTET